jgi:hypothetical protein
MKRLLVMIMASVFAMALAAGCKKDKDKAGGGTDTTASGGGGGGGGDMTVDQACDKTISMMQSMAAAVESNKGNCDGMGAALEKWVADNKSFIEWGKKQDGDAAKKKEFEEKCTPKLTPIMEKVGPAMMGAQECQTNEKVKAAMAAME